jgi:YYY domain-containing protein
MRLDEAHDAAATDEAQAEQQAPQGAMAWRARALALARRIDWTLVALFAVALVALWLRLFDINWDANTHLHPDERKITLVAQCLGLKSVPAGCQPVPDPANPYFFAYGSFPMYLLALVAHGLAHLFAGRPGLPTDGGTFDDYNHFTLVGRALSALFDTGTVLVVGFTVRRLATRWWGVFAAAFVAFTAFEIQLSHFYAVDTVLTFFVTLTLFGALGLAGWRKPSIAPPPADATAADDPPLDQRESLPKVRVTLAWSVLTGVAFGLALTSKISALPLAVPIALALIIRWRKLGLAGWGDIALSAVALISTTFITVVATMPYMFLDAKDFWHDINEQSALAKGTIVYPYTIQFAGRLPYLDQLKNLFVYDMGWFLAAAGCAGVLYAVARVWRRWDDVLIIPLSWVLIYFGITGGFYTKFSRYQLPIFPMLAVLAAVLLGDLHARLRDVEALHVPVGWPARLARVALHPLARLNAAWQRTQARRWLAPTLGGIVIAGGIFMTAAFMQIYVDPMTRLAASDWIYQHVPAGSIITHEVWDDGLPLPRAGNNQPYQYQYEDMSLYDADTTDKATQMAQQISTADVIVIASDRIVASVAAVPDTYPLTNHYYQLLYQGKLGFHLAKTFANNPHLWFFNLPDNGLKENLADESYSVYDHPTVWIFTRDPGPRQTANQVDQQLLAGVTLPPVVTSLASQKPLLLTPQQQAADQATAPLWQTFDPQGLATKLALPLWWIAIEILGLLAFPLAYCALPGLRDRGWGLAKALGVLLLSYAIWLPASVGLLPYERGTVWLAFVALAGIGGGIFWRRRREILAFMRERRREIILTEIVTLVAFLLFVWFRALFPDLWHLYRGGEKPMELAFLDGILRSRTLPPLDPWFAGGAINYYYFGQFLIATLIQLTGIVPETAFNLAIPMLFALTVAGALSVIGGISRRWWVGLVGGIFLAALGNLDGLGQFWQQAQQWLAHVPITPFDYWASSRVIPFTINEFPLWSFVYSDLHAHVIDLPIVLLGLGAAASLLAQPHPSFEIERGMQDGTRNDTESTRNDAENFTRSRVIPRSGSFSRSRYATLALAALALGAMACINTWDAPTYGIVIVVALLAVEWRRARSIARQSGWRAVLVWPEFRRVGATLLGLGVAAIGLYLPFYTHFQSFVTGTGPVTTPTDPLLFLRLFGLWLFLIATFFVLEIRDRWEMYLVRHPDGFLAGIQMDTAQRTLALALATVVVLTVVVLLGVKIMLLLVIGLGVWLATTGNNPPARQFALLLIILGALVALVVEIIYLRDFLDGGDWERMNTVFKFYYQVWLLFALGAALAFYEIVRRLIPPGFFIFGHVAPQTVAAADLGDYADAPADAIQNPPAIADADAPITGVQLALTIGEGDGPAEFVGEDIAAREIDPWPVSPLQEPANGMIVGWALRGAWLAALVVLIFGALVFPVEGTQARLAERTNWGPVQPVNALQSVPSLDGFAYMYTWYPGDAAAITWINMHISGAPVLLEATGDPYQWYSRVAIYTGLPSVLGWGSHESQQRYADEVYNRQPDVDAMYSVGDPKLVLNLLHQYHVQYVYVGQLECLDYAAHDPQPTFGPSPANIKLCAANHDVMGPLTVFNQLVQQNAAQVVYQSDSVTIWKITG